ncbi:hypothetical protein BaRGS_00002593, partial [Batillaria attramentaria]
GPVIGIALVGSGNSSAVEDRDSSIVDRDSSVGDQDSSLGNRDSSAGGRSSSDGDRELKSFGRPQGEEREVEEEGERGGKATAERSSRRVPPISCSSVRLVLGSTSGVGMAD